MARPSSPNRATVVEPACFGLVATIFGLATSTPVDLSNHINATRVGSRRTRRHYWNTTPGDRGGIPRTLARPRQSSTATINTMPSGSSASCRDAVLNVDRFGEEVPVTLTTKSVDLAYVRTAVRFHSPQELWTAGMAGREPRECASLPMPPRPDTLQPPQRHWRCRLQRARAMECSSARKYYLVSDLHMGGDGQLQHCDYTSEFIAFLKELEQEGPDTELLIVGDTFGLWEHIVKAHQAIFDQLRATGARIKVTMMVGNHDYDLACDPDFGARLQAYNIHLDKSLILIRTLGDRKIWIEHGQQRDEFNAFPDYGNPHALPVGYFITQSFVSGASRHSDFGRGNWLKDIRSVGTTQIPDWILSNYFYREMSTVLRWVLLPFLLLAGVTVVAIAGETLRLLGIFDYNVLFHNPVMSRLGIINNVLQVVIEINSIFLILFGVPAALVHRDLFRTLRRFRLLTGGAMIPNFDCEESYLKAAQGVF